MHCTRAILLISILGWLLIGSLHRPALGADASAGGYSRPDPSMVRAEVRDILTDQRFAPRKTLWQWFTELFKNWKGPNFKLPSGLMEVMAWIILIWCVLALLAILAHFVWTIAILFGGSSRGRGTPAGGSLAERLRHHSFEELSVMMERLAEGGQFREALGVMMLALLKRLDQLGAIRFHESKTNGEYVLEYAPERAERDDFRHFVTAFEGTVYGGRRCESDCYRGMYNLFERIRAHAEQRPQV